MTEYLAPGVYIEEIKSGPKPIEAASTSTAGFLGQTERGPIIPELVTSFVEFKRIYGSFIDESFLTYAVDGFFLNGGQRCYIGRIVRVAHDSDQTNAITIENIIVGNSLSISTVGPGSWGTRVAVKISNSGLENDFPLDDYKKLFKLTVAYWTKLPPNKADRPLIDPTDANLLEDPDRREPAVLEIFDNLSADPASPNYFRDRINGLSVLIHVDPASGVDKIQSRPTNQELKFLVNPNEEPEKYDGGNTIFVTALDYKGTTETNSNEQNGLEGFKSINEISIVCAPDDNIDGIYDALVNHCEDPSLQDRFAILQSKLEQTPDKLDRIRPAHIESRYAAFYYPWLTILDPTTNKEKLIPPGGHIAGIYARSDIERGVHKAPANEVVKGALSLQFNISSEQQRVLNPAGVNLIRDFPGRGILVWGARTLSSDPTWKYINVRRLFLFLEKSIDEGTQWVIFEPNNEALWTRVRQVIADFLVRLWRTGALIGTTPDQAFFVKVDQTTMSQQDIDNGRLIAIIGIAPVRPSEFVIFRLSKYTADH
jgi:uncharacterized protein